MSKYLLTGGIFAALLLGACAHPDVHQNNDAQTSRDQAHCQALALAEAPPLMWVTTPARIIPETRECTQQLRNVLCANRPGYTIPAIEEDANLQPREQAFNACLMALRAAPAPAPIVAAALPNRPTRQRTPDDDSDQISEALLAATSSQQAKDAANAAPGEWIKDCEQCPQMVRIAPGSFKMGSTDSANEQPVHRVSLPGFYMGRYEVTQQEWRQFMGANPSANKACGARCPVDRISWHDAQAFVKKLSEHTGKQYRLPSEAEWEYAARAGGRATWSFGNDERELKLHAWFNGNSGGAVHPVGLKQANPFGLHDMHGNVWEWVEDSFHGNYSNINSDGRPMQTIGSTDARILRGGSWYNNPRDLRVSKRNPNAADEGYVFFGLRVVRSL
jgi:formylglycine-generating enzyme required for sulfatase activity